MERADPRTAQRSVGAAQQWGTPLHEHCFHVDAAGTPMLSPEHDAFYLWYPRKKTPGALTESAAELLAHAA